MWIRLPVVWLGAALGGSMLGSIGLTVLYPTSDWSASGFRTIGAFLLASLIWTVSGSALLFLVFAGLRGRGLPLGWRLLAVISIGAAMGGLILWVTIGERLAAWGGLFGIATALCWVGLSSATGSLRRAPLDQLDATSAVPPGGD
jgi:hypothetical protein